MADMDWVKEAEFALIDERFSCGCPVCVESRRIPARKLIAALREAEIGWSQTLADHAAATTQLERWSRESHERANEALKIRLARLRSGDVEEK